MTSLSRPILSGCSKVFRRAGPVPAAVLRIPASSAKTAAHRENEKNRRMQWKDGLRCACPFCCWLHCQPAGRCRKPILFWHRAFTTFPRLRKNFPASLFPMKVAIFLIILCDGADRSGYNAVGVCTAVPFATIQEGQWIWTRRYKYSFLRWWSYVGNERCRWQCANKISRFMKEFLNLNMENHRFPQMS